MTTIQPSLLIGRCSELVSSMEQCDLDAGHDGDHEVHRENTIRWGKRVDVAIMWRKAM